MPISRAQDALGERLPRRVVHRPALERRLDDVAAGGLGLLVASAGSGKSVLVGQWVSARPGLRPAALALTRRHDDAVVLARDLLAAFRTAAPEIDAGLAELVPTDGSGLGDALVDGLLDVLATLPHDIVLVLEDVHVLSSRSVVDDVGRLVTALPRTTRAVVTTRRDLTWPLHRLRLDDRVVEIRGAELAFREPDARALLESVSQRELSDAVVKKLVDRTDGWAVGLQLAAISLRTASDVTAFVESFAGSDHLVTEYLLNEVIERQEPDVRRFLLETSVLGWLSADQCDAVTGMGTARSMLDELYRRSMFLIPLDGSGETFRYHHLFAEVLYYRLRVENPGVVDELHHKAARWLLDHGHEEEAIGHLLDAGDAPEAFRVISSVGHRLFERGEASILVRWLGVIAKEPDCPAVVEVNLLAAQLAADDAAAAAETYRRICRRTDLTLGERTAASALYAVLVFRGLPPETVRRLTDDVRDGLRRLGPDAVVVDFLGIGGRDSVEAMSEYCAAIAEFFLGDLDRAATMLRQLQTLPGMRYPLWKVFALGSFALVRAWQGHGTEATGVAGSALEEAHAFRTANHHASTHAHLALAVVHLDQFDLDAAEQALAQARLDMRGRTASGTYTDLHRLLEARLAAARQGPIEALGLLRSAASSGTEPAALREARRALEARLLNGLGDIAAVRALLAEDHTAPGLASATVDVALATDDLAGARAALEAWQPSPDDLRSVVRRLIREFMVLTAGGERRAAEGALTEAVAAARADRLRWPFIEVPAALRAVQHGVGRGAWLMDDALREATARLEPRLRGQDELVDPLTQRELVVLGLLPSRRQNQEIAAELFVSPNTIKTQVGSIYRKLGVSGRDEAIARAERLGLL